VHQGLRHEHQKQSIWFWSTIREIPPLLSLRKKRTAKRLLFPVFPLLHEFFGTVKPSNSSSSWWWFGTGNAALSLYSSDRPHVSSARDLDWETGRGRETGRAAATMFGSRVQNEVEMQRRTNNRCGSSFLTTPLSSVIEF
jgi:hypothetical protein